METIQQKEIPLITSLFALGGLVLMFFLAWRDFHLYSILSYEDQVVEWITVVFYLTAFAYGLLFAIARRRFGDGLIAVYCLIAGGEEFSWGQRLMGWNPPKIFMAGNQQQEINFHNFLSGAWHDLAFAGVALGYFVLIPLLVRNRKTAILERLGLSSAPPMFALLAMLLVFLHTWHPFLFSSEWCEAVLAGMFFVSIAFLNRNPSSTNHVLVALGIVLVGSIGLTKLSGLQESSQNAANISYARAEAEQLLKDILEGDSTASTVRLTSGHIRIFEATKSGLFKNSQLRRFSETNYLDEPTAQTVTRRQFAVDPWGMSYWLKAEVLIDGSRRLTIYWFGPNRLRDSADDLGGTNISATTICDDILASATVTH